jgi:hypothetical protein
MILAAFHYDSSMKYLSKANGHWISLTFIGDPFQPMMIFQWSVNETGGSLHFIRAS